MLLIDWEAHCQQYADEGRRHCFLIKSGSKASLSSGLSEWAFSARLNASTAALFSAACFSSASRTASALPNCRSFALTRVRHASVIRPIIAGSSLRIENIYADLPIGVSVTKRRPILPNVIMSGAIHGYAGSESAQLKPITTVSTAAAILKARVFQPFISILLC